MKSVKIFFTNFSAEILLTIVSFLLVAELFFIPAQPQTFDEWVHLLTENAFLNAIITGGIPVSWVDTVANYGLPLGEISHQTTAYLSALLLSVTRNTLFSYNLTLLLGSLLGTFLYYKFLRLHFSQLGSLAGAILFTFAPYRILNIYIRGALPEFFTSAFIPLLFIGIHQLVIKKSIIGIALLLLASALLAFSHPMMIVIGFSAAIFYLGYAVFSLSDWKSRIRLSLVFFATSLVGVLLASYYLFPLVVEIKYFYHGSVAVSNSTYEFLTPAQFLTEHWSYSYPASPGVRESRPQLGIIELLVSLTALLMVAYKQIKKQKVPRIIYWWLVMGLVYTLLLLPISDNLYRQIFVLSGLQFPWRFLTSLLLVPPLLLAYLIEVVPQKRIVFIGIIIAVVGLRFPQLYGKNYVQFPESRYQFSIVNPHGTDMNPIWSGPSYDYPVNKIKAEIIEGKGLISNLRQTPNSRIFSLEAESPVRISDNTFYFPGWTLYVDGKEAPLEFQDQDYRGVMTYRLPTGQHQIKLVYQDTKIRWLGKIISALTVLFVILLYLYFRKQKKLVYQWLRG